MITVANFLGNAPVKDFLRRSVFGAEYDVYPILTDGIQINY